MKRFLTVLIASAMLFSCVFIVSFAEGESEYDRLWAQKVAIDGALPPESMEFEANYPFWNISLLLFLHTDIADRVTVKRHEPNEYDEYEELFYSDSLIIKTPDFALTIPEFEAVTRERCFHAGSTRELFPAEYLLVLEYGITKEELLDAYKEMNESPEAIREKLPVSQEEWAYLVQYYELFGGEYTIPEYLLDALYQEDELQVMKLFACPYTVVVNGAAVTSYDLFEVCSYDFKELKEEDILTKEFRYFMADAQKREKSAEGEALFLKLKAHLAENPPKAGDGTAVYALVFTLSALLLAGLCVYGWKKRRRAI